MEGYCTSQATRIAMRQYSVIADKEEAKKKTMEGKDKTKAAEIARLVIVFLYINRIG